MTNMKTNKIAAILVLLCTLPCIVSAQNQTITFDPALRHQTFQGFGQGSMHQQTPRWFDAYSTATLERILDSLYTLKDDGLGMSICRFNFMVGDAPDHTHMNRRPGGSRSPLGLEPTPGNFDWSSHDKLIWHAVGAQKRGATMLAFWNSPPFWMTLSGCTSGGKDPSINNTAPEFEKAFAVHIATVLKHYEEALNLKFDYVCPINEPESDYWHEGGGQEGCHVDVEQAIRITHELDAALKEFGLKTQIQIFEAAFTKSIAYLDRFLADKKAAAAVPILTVHQYEAKNDKEVAIWPQKAKQAGKGLWMSEWGNWTDVKRNTENELKQAMTYSRKIHQAFTVMNAEAWCMWEPGFLFDRERYGLERRKSFWAVAHYSRFARPGMERITIKSESAAKVTAWIDKKGETVVITLLNDGQKALSPKLLLTPFKGFRVDDFRQTSFEQNFAEMPHTLDKDNNLTILLPKESITSIRLRK